MKTKGSLPRPANNTHKSSKINIYNQGCPVARPLYYLVTSTIGCKSLSPVSTMLHSQHHK